MMKKFSGPNTLLGRMGEIENAAWEARRRNPTPAKKCDGCFRRFQGVPIEEGDDDYNSSGEGEVDAGDGYTSLIAHLAPVAAKHPISV